MKAYLLFAFFFPISALAVVEGARLPKHAVVPASEAARAEMIRRAHSVLDSDSLRERSIAEGPVARSGVRPEDKITCRFAEPDPDDPPNGASPKLTCLTTLNGEKQKLKIKYQNPKLADGISVEANDGIWGETLASRLLWALGFPANVVTPVKVVCLDCPERPWAYTRAKLGLDPDQTAPDRQAALHQSRGRLEFPDAIVFEKFEAREIERRPHQGWSWEEIDGANEDVRVEREALELLAAFIQHFDNKPEQQKLLCLGTDSSSGSCSRPLLMLHDLGLTFGQGFIALDPTLTGAAKRAEKNRIRKLTQTSLRGFLAAPVWSNPYECVTYIEPYVPGGTKAAQKRISEDGRQFLVDRLRTLSDSDLAQLFTLARVERRGEVLDENGTSRAVTISDWVSGFHTKLAQITERHCPSTPRAR